MPAKNEKHGFTLVELCIVLVIVGLILGGVLVGQDMVKGAEARAQIAQIEKYHSAVRTFQDKYTCLPGDCLKAAQFGFAARGTLNGQGDGNGVVQGFYQTSGGAFGDQEGAGESLMFWADLSAAKLIEGSFTAADSTTGPTVITATMLPSYFPIAKIGNMNYIYVWSGGAGSNDSRNYFEVSGISSIGNAGFGVVSADKRITPQAASRIDSKSDDGNPQAGAVRATYLNNGGGGLWLGASGTAATSGSTTTCYDNNNVANAQQNYSTSSAPNNYNCALSFRI